MKKAKTKIQLMVILLSLTNLLFAQEYFARIMAVDVTGRTDTILIGHLGQIGVDPGFGEVNLYNEPYDTLDIRTIQRPNMTCFFDYDEYIDLKVDFRPVCATFPMFSNFVMEVHSESYPVYVILLEEDNFFCGADKYYMKDSMTCQTIESGYAPAPGDTLFTLDGIKPNRFALYPEVMVSNKELHTSDVVNIYPNPTYGFFNINSAKEINNIEIYSAEGGFIESLEIDENRIDISYLPTGIYYLKIDIGAHVFYERIVKI